MKPHNNSTISFRWYMFKFALANRQCSNKAENRDNPESVCYHVLIKLEVNFFSLELGDFRVNEKRTKPCSKLN